jgi:hypothetical protein
MAWRLEEGGRVMNVNLVSAVLINLWLAGWILAGIWAFLRARAETRACPSRKGLPGSPASPVDINGSGKKINFSSSP